MCTHLNLSSIIQTFLLSQANVCMCVCVCERERERAREGLKRTKTYDTLSSGINTERDYILVYYFLLSSPLPQWSKQEISDFTIKYSKTFYLHLFPMDGGAQQAAVYGVARSRTRLSDLTFTFHFHALKKAMAPHSTTLAWKIPWTEESGRMQSMRSLRVGHD